MKLSYDNHSSFTKIIKKNLFKNLVYIINEFKTQFSKRDLLKYMLKIVQFEQALGNVNMDESFNEHAEHIVSNFLRREFRNKITLKRINKLLEYLDTHPNYTDEMISYYNRKLQQNSDIMLEYNECPVSNDISLETEEDLEYAIEMPGYDKNLYLIKEYTDLKNHNKIEARKKKKLLNLP
jgi:hypothetical protein